MSPMPLYLGSSLSMPKDKAGSSSLDADQDEGAGGWRGKPTRNYVKKWGMALRGLGGLLMVTDFVTSWRLLFPFGAALNINFILRTQSEFGLGSRTA